MARRVSTMDMTPEEKSIYRQLESEEKNAKQKKANAEKEERLRIERAEQKRQDAIRLRKARSRELTPWGTLKQIVLDDENSDKGDVIEVSESGFPLKSITTSYPEARSKAFVMNGSLKTFKIEALKKGEGPWSIGIALDLELPVGEYWCSEKCVNKVWYVNSRRGNAFTGGKLIYFKMHDPTSKYFGTTGWSEGHDYNCNLPKGFTFIEGDTLTVTLDLACEEGVILFKKDGQDLPNR